MGELTVILMTASFTASIAAAMLKRFDIAAVLAITAFMLSGAELQNLVYERGELMEKMSSTEDSRWLVLQSRERTTSLILALSALLTAVFFALDGVKKVLLKPAH